MKPQTMRSPKQRDQVPKHHLAYILFYDKLIIIFTACADNPCEDGCTCEDTEYTFRCQCPETNGVSWYNNVEFRKYSQ